MKRFLKSERYSRYWAGKGRFFQFVPFIARNEVRGYGQAGPSNNRNCREGRIASPPGFNAETQFNPLFKI
ncbi:MAG: hypothetical protein OP8BY_1082 [Candidatus Saccharicenans subterraneus]|uniref:Uncharacterized protein n=1 Tax=Candidatus Saccharicenans subterraneus TaxID=2508984 RepID=A0A3E2BQU3_9BACT|nr:MAG: hypothetical protein OP8BY_1082 [Candidatus Saccharicenans subterraneum]